MANMEKIDRVLDYVERNPERLDMGEWIGASDERGVLPDPSEPGWECGTVACFAGWAAILDGWTPTYSAPVASSTVTVRKDGVIEKVWDVARDALELTEREAHKLFLCAYGLDGVRAMVDLLRHGHDFSYYSASNELDEVIDDTREGE